MVPLFWFYTKNNIPKKKSKKETKNMKKLLHFLFICGIILLFAAHDAVLGCQRTSNF